MAFIDVAREFAACVLSIGGVVLDDTQFPASVRKADYWFPQDEVVAELKCLSVDLAQDMEFDRRVVDMHDSWIARRLIQRRADGRVIINTRTLPETCSREFLNYLKRRFESNVLTPANQQIRATKERLDRPRASGLLVVANDADSLLQPDMYAHFLARSTQRQYSSISSTILFSANFPALVRGTSERRNYWVDGLLRNAPAAKRVRENLRIAWFARYQEIVGGAVPVIEHASGDAKAMFERLHYGADRRTSTRNRRA